MRTAIGDRRRAFTRPLHHATMDEGEIDSVSGLSVQFPSNQDLYCFLIQYSLHSCCHGNLLHSIRSQKLGPDTRSVRNPFCGFAARSH
jgi:hypothetical protein